jgi:hypothetical protein
MSKRKTYLNGGFHYLIRLTDVVSFEIQVKTREELLFGELDHDFCHKNKYGVNEKHEAVINRYYWLLHKHHLKEYKNYLLEK